MPKQILLCDDEIHIVRAAEFKLRRAGYDVRCASNGEEGWAEIMRSKPDVLITDCQMPCLDGLGLCKRVREHEATRDLPVLMLTAKGYEIMEQQTAKDLDILAIIAKPFSPRDLLNRVEAILGPATLVASAEA